MKQKEILAAINEIKKQLANCQCSIALLEELLNNESANENPVEETPVINEDEDITLPEPPKEIHIDVPKGNIPDEESVIGCQIISELKLDYSGKCDCITLQHPWYDNTGKLDKKGRVIDTLWMETHTVIITLEDINNNVLLTKNVHWDRLYKWHKYLLSKKISKGIPNPDPHKNGMPRKVHLIVGD